MFRRTGGFGEGGAGRRVAFVVGVTAGMVDAVGVAVIGTTVAVAGGGYAVPGGG